MSDSDENFEPWQKAVGWIKDGVPYERTERPMMEIAKKISYYMLNATIVFKRGSSRPPIPMTKGFYIIRSVKGIQVCPVDDCGQETAGVYGCGNWVLPWAALHNIRKHCLKLPDELLHDLELLRNPDEK